MRGEESERDERKSEESGMRLAAPVRSVRRNYQKL
jgi:hypothetical protein